MAGEARVQFLEWLQSVNPQAYSAVISESRDDTMNGMGSIWESLTDAVQKIVPGLVQAKAQRDIYKMQLKRANRGLPPLDVSQVAPVIRTQVGIDPDTRNAIMAEAGAGMKRVMIPLGIGAALLGLVLILNNRKR